MSRLYQVQSVRAHKEVDGQTQYLVHWRNYSNVYDSWEPESNLKDCDKILEDYLLKVKRQSTPKRQTRSRAVAPPPRRSSRLALQETKMPQDSNIESNKDSGVNGDDTDNTLDQAPTEKSEEPVEVEEKKGIRQMKRRSQPNLTATEDASKDNKEKKVYKRHSHSNLVATGSSIGNILDDTQMHKSYHLRQRVQPMTPPVHPTPSSSMLLSSDEEAEILSRRPVRKGRSPHRKIDVAPDPSEGDKKPCTVVKSLSKYKVTVQEGNLLVRRQEAKEPTEAATHKDDEKEVKPAEPIISDVEEEEVVAPSQVVVSAAASTTATNATYPAAPKWMYLNCAEFLLAMLLTALFFITYWCWNSDVC